ncbi:serine/threonine-protein kinase UCNL-like [Typha latifolia]|uniref:serine/threonine-protein kinase UCNL-like n=1 Tax=Typha latifolia TaxID=4733 RepID=UPI003C30BB30
MKNARELMELHLDELRVVRVLGRGAMGTVLLVTARSSSTSPSLFALKVFDKNSPTMKPESDRRARWEVSVLSGLSHPFLPSLFASFETPELLAWAIPFCSGGDLNALRHSLSDQVFSSAAIRFYLSEIVSALAHLHSLNIVYRDLKPENVLIQSSGHLTLTDFDLSRYLSPKPPSSPPRPPPIPRRRRRRRRNLIRILFAKEVRSARVSPVSRRRGSFSGAGTCERSCSFVGTEEYVAPEVVRGEGHEFAVDWWALGILAYEMAYGKTPFRGRNRKETFRNVLTRQPEFVGRQGSDLTDLIGRLLEKDPTQRLGYAGGAEEVKAHPFFSGVRWDLLTEVARPPFLAPVEELEEEVTASGADGTAKCPDVREYFKRLHEPPRPRTDSPLVSSVSSLTEF